MKTTDPLTRRVQTIAKSRQTAVVDLLTYTTALPSLSANVVLTVITSVSTEPRTEMVRTDSEAVEAGSGSGDKGTTRWRHCVWSVITRSFQHSESVFSSWGNSSEHAMSAHVVDELAAPKTFYGEFVYNWDLSRPNFRSFFQKKLILKVSKNEALHVWWSKSNPMHHCMRNIPKYIKITRLLKYPRCIECEATMIWCDLHFNLSLKFSHLEKRVALWNPWCSELTRYAILGATKSKLMI